MVIRRANKEDFSILFDYIEKLWAYNQYDKSRVKALFEEIVNDRNSFVFLLEDAGCKGFIHGCLMNTFWMSGKTCYISSLFVEESEREKGYGGNLLQHVKKYASECNCKALILDSGFPREEAHRFYENLGFEKSCYGFEMIL